MPTKHKETIGNYAMLLKKKIHSREFPVREPLKNDTPKHSTEIDKRIIVFPLPYATHNSKVHKNFFLAESCCTLAHIIHNFIFCLQNTRYESEQSSVEQLIGMLMNWCECVFDTRKCIMCKQTVVCQKIFSV